MPRLFLSRTYSGSKRRTRVMLGLRQDGVAGGVGDRQPGRCHECYRGTLHYAAWKGDTELLLRWLCAPGITRATPCRND